MKNALKIGGVLLIIAILIGAGTLLVRRRAGIAAAEIPAPTAIATRGHIEETVSATGNVIADRETTLGFASSGTVAEVLVEEGQQVEAGEVLARLDTSSLEWQIASAQASLDTAQLRLEQAQQPASAEDIASAQAAVDSAKASYEKVKAGPTAEDLASTRAALASAKAEYARVKAGPTQDDLTSAKATLESARAKVQQAQANYDRIASQPNAGMTQEALDLQNATLDLQKAQASYDATANHPTASELASAAAQVASAEAQLSQLLQQPAASDLASAAAQVNSAEAQLAQLLAQPKAEDVAVSQAQVQEATVALEQAKAKLGDALIVAPFASTILQVQIREGEWTTTGASGIVLAATRPLYLDVNVDEVDVAQIAEGQVAHISFDAVTGEEITGTVTYVAPASINVEGAIAYVVKVRFDPGALPVRLGMTANVDIVAASADDTLLVPSRAVTADREAGRYYVTRQIADGSIQRLEVRIGLRSESETQILEGLNEGDRVVLPQLPTTQPGFPTPSFRGGGFGQGEQ
jgi:HlyD family secretion protein